MALQLDHYQVRKCAYSRKPWRIIDSSRTMGHQGVGQDGPSAIPGPVGFDRKRDAVAALAALTEDIPQT